MNRFLIKDPADLETEVFDNSIDGPNQSNNNANNVSRASISKSIISRTSTSSMASPNKLTSNDSFDNKSLTNSKPPLNKSLSNMSEFDMIHRKSIESSLFDYANELIATYRVKNLFEMFSNLRFINFTKWLQISQ